uniref:Choline kinase n=1 Tax=Rhabditophanes sp. KR3021 TaxID=114890 RepID=A0AC35TPE9_9BILA
MNIFTDDSGNINRDKVLQVLDEKLKIAWPGVDELCVSKISGGYSNLLLKIEDIKFGRKGVLRIYGNHITNEKTKLKNILVAQALHEQNLGPKMFFHLPCGYFEEFLDGHSLHMNDLHKSEITSKLGYQMGKIHALKIDIDKSKSMWDDIGNWIDLIEDELKEALKLLSVDEMSKQLGLELIDKCVIPKDENEILIKVKPELAPKNENVPEFINIKMLRDELSFIKQSISKCQSEIVFCHNDCHEGNMLFDDEKRTLLPIDFEYASYNHRAFDFSQTLNHFAWEYGAKNKLGYRIFMDKYPNQEQLVLFFTNYLKAFDNTKATVSELIKESEIFKPLPHFVWTVWGITKHFENKKCAELSHNSASFDRLSMYYIYKNELIKKLDDL